MSQVTIEAIDKVLARLPKATYKQAKEALQKTDGNVVEAIIYLESNYSDLKGSSKKTTEIFGKTTDELKEQVNAMGIGDKVYFAGYMAGKDVQKMYKAADIAVFPSTYEPFGIVALEAMLSENPIVVSDIGGLNEIVQHKENGMKTYCGNPNSIADAILELLYDHKLCAEITKKAKNKVRNEYNWNKISQDTHFAYQKAICQSMAEKQKRELEQERAKKTKKAKNTEKEITNLLDFKKRHAYA